MLLEGVFQYKFGRKIKLQVVETERERTENMYVPLNSKRILRCNIVKRKESGPSWSVLL